MKIHASSRCKVAILIAAGPLFAIAACGGADEPVVAQDDAATAEAAIDTSTSSEGAPLEDANRDASKTDARHDAEIADAARVLNSCGGYGVLELDAQPATPGTSCGACADGTIACTGSDTVTCAGASAPPCPTPPVDAGPNACGGFGPLTFLSEDASVGDPCGECGHIQCASSTSVACGEFGGACPIDAGLQSACIIPSSAYSAVPPSPTLPSETRPTATSVSTIGLPAKDLAFNPYDGFLYASIASGVSQGNSIAKIDPMSATVVQTIYVGPSPTSIALSDDGKALWVVTASPSVRRVDLTTFSAGASLALPPNAGIFSLQVLAGTEDSVAVDSFESTTFSVLVYDNGIPRPYGAQMSNAIQRMITPSPSLLFAAHVAPPSLSVATLCLNDNGAFTQKVAEPLTSSYLSAPPVFYEGVLYNPDGSAYDAQTGNLIHQFSVRTLNALVAVDQKDVYYLTLSGGETNPESFSVTGFDRTTYASTITDPLGLSGVGTSAFLRWGRYGFAYLTDAHNIVIARSTIIPDMP